MRRTPRQRSIDAIRRADLLICGSRFLQKCLSDLVPDVETVVHYIGVPLPDLPPATDRGGPLHFLAVSRLHPVKGVDLTIASFFEAFGRNGEAELTILGDGPLRDELQQQVDRLGMTDLITLRGQVSPQEVEQSMHQADVFVQHNRRLDDGSEEALGGSILEASACGLPVIAARSGGIEEAVQQDIGGLLFESGDVDRMADGMRHLAEDPGLRRSLGEKGRAHIECEHNAAIQDARLNGMLQALAQR